MEKDKKGPLTVRKLMEAEKYDRTVNIKSRCDWDEFIPEDYFFYGTLMDPETLANDLNLSSKQLLHPAKVRGCSVKLWGEYPALVDEPPEHDVHGVAFDLKAGFDHETDMYNIRSCWIRLYDGEEVGLPEEIECRALAM